MSRHDILEKILAARYDFDYAPRESKSFYQKALFDLVDTAIAGTDVSKYELLQSIHDRYLDFKRNKRKMEKVSISQRLQ